MAKHLNKIISAQSELAAVMHNCHLQDHQYFLPSVVCDVTNMNKLTLNET